MNLAETIEAALARCGVEASSRIGVAVSGGADSVALLHLLAQARTRIRRTGGPSTGISVLHVDHRMREGSQDDADLVAEMATDLGADFHLLTTTVDRAHRESPEAAARRVRYEALSACAEREGLDWVATAHTLDDQAETVLMRVLRGAGTDGLAGIAAVRGIFVRPALDVRRDDLRRWLSERGIAWRHDPTNDDLRYERNWIRHAVMPMLRERRGGVDLAIARLAGHAGADAETLEGLAEEVLARAEIDDLGMLVPIGSLPRSIASRVVRRGLWRMGADTDARGVEATLGLEVGQRQTVGAVVVHRVADGLVIASPDAPPLEAASLPLGETTLPSWGLRVRVGPPSAPPYRWRTHLPRVAGAAALRSRRPGDRVPTPSGTRKVQDVLVDARIPRLVRDRVPVLASDDRALAVVGLTASPADSDLVVDAEPISSTWSRGILWNRASS